MPSGKRISDPVHGTILLNPVEAEVLSSQAFQRIRRIKHLGLASLVFPGADFSRLSHSVGTCCVMGKLVDALRLPASISPEDERQYRMAALLHDVGHFPFSHPTEDAAKDHYVKSAILGEEGEPVPEEGLEFIDHEHVGRLVVEQDPEIRGILSANGYVPEIIAGLITREKPDKLANLISSDLDADRIDYLLRTAVHTGLPFGIVDFEYLLSQLVVDSSGQICVNRQAMRTVDHFLLARYFDRIQVARHKTVSALESVLIEVVRELLAKFGLDFSKKWVTDQISNGLWNKVDDDFLWRRITEAREQVQGEVTKARFDAVTNRIPPKLIGEYEVIEHRGNEASDIEKTRRLINSWAKSYAQEKGLEDGSIFVLVNSLQLTKSSAMRRAKDEPRPDDYEQAIRIMNADGSSSAILDKRNSLMSVLSNYGLFTIRVYALRTATVNLNLPNMLASYEKEMAGID